MRFKSIVKDIQKGLRKCFVKNVAEWKSSGRHKSKQNLIEDVEVEVRVMGYTLSQVEDDGYAKCFYLDKLSN
mgnify:CR=1 FL=1